MDQIEARGTDAERRRAEADRRRLEQDGSFAEPLQRMYYEAGVMVGVEAMRAEQDYLLRRLARLQRMVLGSGTLYGLKVSIGTETRADGKQGATVAVAPGQAIDGLGREVLLPEAYAISLTDWIAAQPPTALEEAFGDGALHLRVTLRAADSPRGFQPSLATGLNIGTDAVVTSRVADSFLLELLPEPPQGSAFPADAPADAVAAWLPDGQRPPAQPEGLTQRERDFLTALPDVAQARQLALAAHRLGQAPPDPCRAAPDRLACLAAAARIPLARIALAADAAQPALAAPGKATVNNLIRPFVQPLPLHGTL
ncbi:hypothetical protein [Paracraurococcus ruber]|uniref:Uncharacterized protein n=1 Tax=Paracraurococcus ruber TaxID=77675 RepID=A0ABS1D2J8_9PROT|nr:hypothetical protein [Paracraurococcus ruber]MBK1660984.1 hypothetical protein [Paracraurococcus ruber]TDG21896.1 hypothetical protein E2C05_26920 [Paracraurococcus ruber]